MSSKEEGTKGAQEKKTKKKKPSKSSEEKTAEKVEVKEDQTKDQTSQEKSKEEQDASIATERKPSAIQETVEETLEVFAPDSGSTSVEPSAKSSQEKNVTTQETKKEEIKPMDLEKLIELKEAFSLFDFNHDGIIDLQDLKYTFASLGKPDFPEEEMKKMLNEAAQPVDFDAFVALFGYKVSTLDPEEVFTKALATWDMREIGMIPEDRFRRDIQHFGDKFTVKDSDNALEEAPVFVNEGTSMIDYVKFSSNICGFRNVERTRKHQKNLENIGTKK